MRWAILVLAACAEAPDEMQIVAGRAGEWALSTYPAAEVDLDRVVGPQVALRVDASVSAVFDPESVREDGTIDTSGLVEGDDDAEAAWIAHQGVAVPTELDTLAMFTTYAHVVEGLAWLDDLGVRDEVTAPIVVYYDPEVRGSPLTSDNAFYLRSVDAMGVLRPDVFEGIPMGMNEGILVHELGHRVASFELWDGQALTATLELDTDPEAIAYLRALSLDEGIADYLGAVYAENPDFVRATTELPLNRDLAEPKRIEPAWVEGYEHMLGELGLADPYVEGAVTASALWAAGELVGHERVLDAVIEGMRAVSPRVIGLAYQLGDFEQEVARRLGPDACAPFLEAFAPIAERFGGCA